MKKGQKKGKYAIELTNPLRASSRAPYVNVFLGRCTRDGRLVSERFANINGGKTARDTGRFRERRGKFESGKWTPLSLHFYGNRYSRRATRAPRGLPCQSARVAASQSAFLPLGKKFERIMGRINISQILMRRARQRRALLDLISYVFSIPGTGTRADWPNAKFEGSKKSPYLII